MERSLFLGNKVSLISPLHFRSRGNAYRISAERDDEEAQKLQKTVRTLDRRSSSLDKWVDDGISPSSSSGRWEKVKSRYSPKQQWKPGKTGSQDVDHTIRIVKDTDDDEQVEGLGEGKLQVDAGSHEDLKQPYELVFEKAKKQAIEATKYLKSLTVHKILYPTGEPPSYNTLLPLTETLITGLGVIILFGIVLDALMWRINKIFNPKVVSVSSVDGVGGDVSVARPPSALSVLLERDLRRKESLEWVNMVIGKLWNLYRRGLESWLVSLLQPIIDGLEKPDYVKKVEVKQFFLGDEPLTLRTVERRTSRRADDLQYHIGVRYTGGARLLLYITLKWGIIPITLPVGVRGLDVDAEVWLKMRMVPSDPWVGQATWAFVTLPKIKLALAPFRLLNLMAIPFLSIFLAKLLTEDLPMLFVRPNKNVVDFLQGRVVGPVSKDFKEGILLDGSRSFSGELSVTLVAAKKLWYIPYLKTDPYAIFVLGEQVLRSKKNSQTSIIGPPGAPVWNQDFKLLVVDQRTQHLSLTLHDTIGFTSYPVGSADLDLRTLQDTVPVDRKLTLKSGWGPLPKRVAGEVILRLTYKAYIEEDELDGQTDGELIPKGFGAAGVPGAVEQVQEVATFFKEEAGKVAEFFQDKDLAKDMFSSLSVISSNEDAENALPILGIQKEGDKKAESSPAVVRAQERNAKITPSIGSERQARLPAAEGSVKQADKLAADIGQGQTKSTSEPGPIVESEGDKVIISNQPDQLSENTAGDVKLVEERQVFLWLTLAAGIVWLVAADLNVSNLFNP